MAGAASTTTEVTTLKEKVKSLELQVKMLQDGQTLAVTNAELKAQNSIAEKLLARYIQGLRDGASLAAGEGLKSPL